MDNNNWFDFPINVFVDSEVYISEAYNFNPKGNLDFFKKLVHDNKINHLTSEIVIKEVEKHIYKDVQNAIDRYNKIKDGRCSAIFRDREQSPFHSIDEKKVLEEAMSIFREFLSDSKALKLDMDKININSVLSDYFEGRHPFGNKKDKKSEFPDAFNLEMIRKYANYNSPIIIVSGDSDFLEEKNIRCFNSLSELLNTINSQDKITQKLRDYLETQMTNIHNKVESEILYYDHAIEIDGRDVDRKGYWDGYEYEECELLSVVSVRPTDHICNIDVIYVDNTDKIIIVNYRYRGKLEFNCSFFDDLHSIWDSVDKEYVNRYYGIMNEMHHVEVPLTISVSFEKNNESIEFEIENIDFDINIRLDQYTLIKGSRNRIDNPHDYWREDYESYINICPDCNREMTIENDGGNGFCIECAPNH